MRFPLVARRVILTPALVLALAAVAACSSSSSSSSSAPTSSAPVSSAPASSPAATSSGSAATAQITSNWEKFFDSSTPVSEKINLVQNGSSFSSAISDLAKLPIASGLGAKVTGVTVNSASSATVTYDLTSGSSSLLTGEHGTAVYQDGIWKVGDTSLCGLFKLVPGGTLPAACNSAS